MVKEVKIDDPLDILIIKSFDISKSGILKKESIIKSVKISDNASEGSISKRIEFMANPKKGKNYLIRVSRSNYKRNPEIKFEYHDADANATPLNIGQNQILREHTTDLKGAIQTWIDNLPELSPDYPAKAEDRYISKIAICESHILFSDLNNHLPGIGSDILERWEAYKKELIELDGLKEDLFSSIKGEITRCFEGLPLRFVFDDGHRLEDHECYLNPLSLYKVIMDLTSGDEGYKNHLRFLTWLKFNTPIVDKGNHVLWGEAITYMRVPARDHDLLKAGIPRFMEFFEDIASFELMTMSDEIIAKVNTLGKESGSIRRELKRVLLYASYPGNCEYLG